MLSGIKIPMSVRSAVSEGVRNPSRSVVQQWSPGCLIGSELILRRIQAWYSSPTDKGVGRNVGRNVGRWVGTAAVQTRPARQHSAGAARRISWPGRILSSSTTSTSLTALTFIIPPCCVFLHPSNNFLFPDWLTAEVCTGSCASHSFYFCLLCSTGRRLSATIAQYCPLSGVGKIIKPGLGVYWLLLGENGEECGECCCVVWRPHCNITLVQQCCVAWRTVTSSVAQSLQ